MKVTSSSGVSNTTYHNRTYCYLKKENEIFLKFYVNNFSYFEISASLF